MLIISKELSGKMRAKRFLIHGLKSPPKSPLSRLNGSCMGCGLLLAAWAHCFLYLTLKIKIIAKCGENLYLKCSYLSSQTAWIRTLPGHFLKLKLFLSSRRAVETMQITWRLVRHLLICPLQEASSEKILLKHCDPWSFVQLGEWVQFFSLSVMT